MKLQPKREANIAAQQQKKAAIDEGLQLEKIVSSLRQERVKEEQNLEQFRRGSIATVQQEIDLYTQKRDDLIEEIKQKTAQAVKANIPITVVMEQLKVEKEEIEKQALSLLAREQNILEEESKIEKVRRTTEVEKGQAQDLLSDSSKKFSEADRILREAREDAAEIRNKAQIILSSVEAREKELELRFKDFDARKAATDLQDEKNKDWERDLFRRELELKAGWKNLEQTAERIKSGKL